MTRTRREQSERTGGCAYLPAIDSSTRRIQRSSRHPRHDDPWSAADDAPRRHPAQSSLELIPLPACVHDPAHSRAHRGSHSRDDWRVGARQIRHACLLSPALPIVPLPVPVVVTTPGGPLVSAVRLTVTLPPALLSTAVAAVGLAAVTRPADAEDDAALFSTTANGHEEDVGHAPSSSPP